MKFRTFYLFYLLTILLLVLGLFTRNVETSVASWHQTTIRGMWPFFIPTSICSVLTALIYNYKFSFGRPVANSTIILHLILVIFGLFLSVNFYWITMFLWNAGLLCSTAYAGGISAVSILLGPVLLIASLVVFFRGLNKSAEC